MADETTGQGVVEAPQGTEPTIDWKAESRKHERRAKENKALADQAVKELEDLKASIAEQQRAKEDEEKSLTERLNEANERVKALEAQQERDRMVRKVAEEQGVNAELLLRMSGTTSEEIAENAALIQKVVSKSETPQKRGWEPVKDRGESRSTASKAEILAIKDPKERRKAINENLDLFK